MSHIIFHGLLREIYDVPTAHAAITDGALEREISMFHNLHVMK